MSSPKKLILEVVIERNQILIGNHSDIAARFSPDALDPTALREHFDSIIFEVRGFNTEIQPTFATPEVRDFFQKLHKEWPYFLYFCHSGGQGLWDYVFCQLSTLTVLPKDSSSKSQVNYSPAELFKIVGDSLAPLERISEAAGFDAEKIRMRSREILKYFKFLKGPPRN